METAIMGYVRVILGLYRDNGKENGNYYSGIIYGLRLGWLDVNAKDNQVASIFCSSL